MASPIALFLQSAPAASNPLIQGLPIVLIFGIFYFLLFLPMQKQKKAQKKMLEELKTAPYVLQGERLRTWRALEALEKCATPEACETIAVLATGEAAARFTREAKLALNRLRKWGVATHPH